MRALYAATVIVLGCGARTAEVAPDEPTTPSDASVTPDAAHSDSFADSASGAFDGIAAANDGAHAGRYVDPDGSFFTYCGGKPCRGRCWPTPDQCDCNGVAGGCPDYAVCCPGISACVGSCR